MELETRMTLTDNQKEMIADLLSRTDSYEDIKEFSDRILGNAYGNKETAKVFKQLAGLRMKRL